MDYTIKDMDGFALITQSATDVTVVAVPLPMGEDFFAFARLATFEERTFAVEYVGALIATGHRPEDFINDDREEAEDGPADERAAIADLPAHSR